MSSATRAPFTTPAPRSARARHARPRVRARGSGALPRFGEAQRDAARVAGDDRSQEVRQREPRCAGLRRSAHRPSASGRRSLGSRTSALPVAITSPCWFVHGELDARDRAAARVAPVDAGHLAAQERRGRRSGPASGTTCGCCTTSAHSPAPVRQVVEHPGPHRGAVAVAARHADQLRRTSPARVRGRGRDRDRRRGSGRSSRPRGRATSRAASPPDRATRARRPGPEGSPGAHQEGAPLGGEARSVCGPIGRTGGARLPSRSPVARGRGRGSSGQYSNFSRSTSSRGSSVQAGSRESAKAPRRRASSARYADRGGALLRDDLAALVDVGGVAAGEHRRPGELRLGDFVVEQHALECDAVAGLDARPEEPPLVAAERHVGAGDVFPGSRARAVRYRSVQTTKDWGATRRPKRLSAAKPSS